MLDVFQNEAQAIWFDDDGGLAPISAPSRFHGHIEPVAPAHYHYIVEPIEARLGGAIDERLTQPASVVALDSGIWEPGPFAVPPTVHAFVAPPVIRGPSQLVSAPGPDDEPSLHGTFFNFYDECEIPFYGDVPLFHPQHIVRLANKNGRAYFAITQSREHNGYLSIVRTYAGQIDPRSDALIAPAEPVVGEYVWQDLYTGTFNGRINVTGNWNHPGKMDVIDGVLIVAAENWEPGRIPGQEELGLCAGRAGNNLDAVLFYDVRDPENPRYWGQINMQEMGIPDVASVAINRTPEGHYILRVDEAQFWSDRISPNIEDWLPMMPSATSFTGQHGKHFNSLQQSSLMFAPNSLCRAPSG